MKTLRVLHLDGAYPAWNDRHLASVDFTIELTSETEADKMSGAGGMRYGTSPRSRELAAGATPDRYDAVIIGNNRGHGQERAKLIPVAMRDRTMIVWNAFTPGEEAPYRWLGFSHFGQRHVIGPREVGILSEWEFIKQMAAAMASP